ncbi:MAG: hypothetical protein IJH53_09860 [Oscillospiraceae bacterium]|nr:hypothetical protein [Oscillospiraceae bacterium]
MKRTVSFIMAALLAVLLFPAAALAEAADGSGEIVTASVSVIDEAELDAEIERIIDSSGRNRESVSVALYYTGTGEYYYYNANRWWYTASLFKLPLVMKMANMKKYDEIDYDSFRLDGFDIEEVFHLILRYSDSHWAYAMQQKMFGDDLRTIRRNDLSFSEGILSEELPRTFYVEYLYSARFYLGIVKQLYENPDEYPNVLQYMCEASPDDYFHKVLKDRYVIAQKYGSAGGCCHTGGIIYTPEPVILVVMNYEVNDFAGNKMIGDISAYIADCAENWHLALEDMTP